MKISKHFAYIVFLGYAISLENDGDDYADHDGKVKNSSHFSLKVFVLLIESMYIEPKWILQAVRRWYFQSAMSKL